MIALLDTSHDLKGASKELGCEVNQLLTPLTRFKLQFPEEPFAIENGCFKRFDESAYLALIERERHRMGLCRFLSVPDVVADARRTLECFEHWSDKLELRRWPLALVAQDGQENLPIPWDKIAAIFIGGSTKWKLGPQAAAIIKTARIIGKWVHVGRVNKPARFEYFEKLGADSIDGTGLALYSWMRKDIWKAHHEPQLFK